MKRVLAAMAAVLLLSGCVGIPDAGPVQMGRVAEDDDASELVFLPEPPAPGASQEEVVLGFLRAAISPSDDFAIARQYLTRTAASQWEPNAGVTIRSSQPEIVLSGEASAEARISVTGSVDETGALEETDEEASLAFELGRVAGEWRIVSAPNGIVLSAYHFEQLFESHALHWFTPDDLATVEEIRWFERTATTLPDRIVDAVLEGPSEWLAPAVGTAAGQGVTRLGRVAVDGAMASLTVSFAQIEQRGSASLERLAVQFARSLDDLGIREVVLGVDGLDDFTASSDDAPPLDEGPPDQRPIVLEGSSLHVVGDSAGSIGDVGATLAELGATAFSVREDGAGVALAESRAVWVAPGSDPVEIATGVATEPALDPAGWVLLVDRGAPNEVRAWRDGEERMLPLPPPATSIEAMALSRDGSQLAFAATAEGRGGVWVSAIIRDADGAPVALTTPVQQRGVDGRALDLTWTSPTSVAVLAASSAATSVVQLEVGGVVVSLPTPDFDVRAIVGGIDGVTTLRALSADGQVLSPRGQVWVPNVGLEDVALIATRVR